MAGVSLVLVVLTLATCHGITGATMEYVNWESYRELKDELSLLKQELRSLMDMVGDITTVSETSTIGASLYTRWGRTVCPEDVERVYVGIMSSALNTDTGSGNNFLCLPFDPQYANYTESVETSRGGIYGTEYQGDPDLIFDSANRGGPTFVDQDVPCAVCNVNNRSSVLMIPAKTTCPDGWTREYFGYLTSASKNSGGSRTFECVDYQPETLFGGAESAPAAFIYNVEGRCGALSCPNYVDGRELTCVVCSK